MKKIFIYLICMLFLIGSVAAATITRTVTSSGSTHTVKYVVSGSSGAYGGIITETIPSGFTINSASFTNSFDVFGKKITGQLIEMPFAGSSDTQYCQYTISGSSGTLSGGKVDWSGSAMQTLPSASIGSGGDTTEPAKGNSTMMYVIIGAVGFLAVAMMLKKK